MKFEALPRVFKVVDGFLSNYDDVLAEAERAKYRIFDTPIGAFPGMALYDSPWAYEKLAEELGFPVKKVIEFFRRYEEGVPQPTFIHPDYMSELSATLSLARPGIHNGSFRLWRHRETGAERPDFKDPDQMDRLWLDGTDESKWEATEEIEMVPNRCVIYSADLFHSRWPRDWRWDRPRMIQTFFFNQRRD